MLNLSQYFPITDPTLIFFVVLLMILFSSIIMERLRISHIIGMVLASVLARKYGLSILGRDVSFELFGHVGLYYIMFLTDLEMDMEGLKKNRNRVMVFGMLTLLVPFAMTCLMGVSLLGYLPLASPLLVAIMASNMLIAYPIVGRYGLTRYTSSTLSVGSSMMALFMALVVMVSIINSFYGNGGISFWPLFTLKFVVYCVGLTVVIPRVTRWFLRRYSDAVMQFISILAVVFLSAALSDAVGLEGIFGAFMSSLISNRFVPKAPPLMNRIEFTENALFIPYFLIGVGMLINVRLLFVGSKVLWVVFYIVFFGTLGKAVAAYLAARIFHMSWLAGYMIFGLTSAHAAGVIAMVMVGRRLQIAPGEYPFGDEVLDGTVIMILLTYIISTVITERTT